MTTPSHQQQPASQNTPSSPNGQHQAVAQQLAALQAKKGHAIPLQSVSQGIQPQKKERFASWTGFSGKTLWDWLDLLSKLASAIVIPLLIFFVTQSFTSQQAQLSDSQHQREVDAANLQHKRDVDAANLQHQETILKSYQDDLKDLMLTRGLITSKPNDEVRVIARTEVLSALRQLDSERNRVFLQFLQDARLIGGGVDDKGKLQLHNVISFAQADLTGDFLEGANLNHADLNHADLSYALLSGADLNHADLRGAILHGANLSVANLNGANLNGADLHGANLYGANLSGAILDGANLSGADLSSATITQTQLDTASSLSGATMPDGSIHP